MSTKRHAQITLSVRLSDIRFAESHSLLGTLGLFYLGQREEEKDKNHHVSNTIILKNILKFIMNKNEFLEPKSPISLCIFMSVFLSTSDFLNPEDKGIHNLNFQL